MMLKRFVLEREGTQVVLDHLQNRLAEILPNADKLWIEAHSVVIGSNLKTLSTNDVHNILISIITNSQEIPWNFYDVVSEVISKAPSAVKEFLQENIAIKTGYEYEHLRVTQDGHWQIVWEINPATTIKEYREIALDWYIPTNSSKSRRRKKKKPIIPSPILDHISSCVLLLRNKQILPAASVLSVILEAALWDELQAKNLLQKRQEITYAPVDWRFEKYHDQFRLKIEGANKNLKDLQIPPELLMANSNREVIFNISRTHIENSTANTVDLRLSVDKRFVDFLASDTITKIEESEPGRSLSTALERARKEKLTCLSTIPLVYDRTLISLRNSLIHLPSNGKLSMPIPIPGDGAIKTTEELRERDGFIQQLLYLVTQVVQSVYNN